MKIFITGATGYVGTHVTKYLLEKGHTVTVFIKNESKAEYFKKNRMECIIGDITNAASVKAAAEKDSFDAVIHLAFSLFPSSDPKVNIDGIDNMISAFKYKKIKKFIYISSGLVYKSTDVNALVDENTERIPNMTFAKQQVRAEDIFLQAYREMGFPIVIIRPSEIFGGENGYFTLEHLNGLKNRRVPMIGNGSGSVSFSYIGDVIQVINRSLEIDKAIGHAFNVNIPDILTVKTLNQFITDRIGAKKPYKIPVFAAYIAASLGMLIAKITGKKPFISYDIVKVAAMKAGQRDITKSKEILGLQPKYQTIFEGLDDCYFKD